VLLVKVDRVRVKLSLRAVSRRDMKTYAEVGVSHIQGFLNLGIKCDEYYNNNNNNIYLLQLGFYPVAVVILHVNKT